jgi:hypothetical protein
MSKLLPASRSHDELLATAAIFRHGLSKFMSKQKEYVEVLSKKNPVRNDRTYTV